MSTAAEFDRCRVSLVSHGNNSYSFTVLFAEQCHSTQLLSLGDRHFLHCDIQCIENVLVYKSLDLSLFLIGHSLKVRKVETQSLAVNQLTCLMNVITKNTSQCSLQQMCAAVVSHGSQTLSLVNLECNLLTNCQRTLSYFYFQCELSANCLLCIQNFCFAGCSLNDTCIAGLSAAFSIETSLVGNDVYNVLNTGIFDKIFIISKIRDYSGVFGLIIACELCRNVLVDLVENSFLSTHVALRFSCTSCSLSLLLHANSIAFFISRKSLFFQYLSGQIKRETIGVGKLEAALSVKSSLALSLKLLNILIQDLHASVDSGVEVLFLGSQNLHDVVELFFKLVIFALVTVNNSLYKVFKEQTVYTKQFAVTDSTSEKSSHNIASAFVRGQYTVGSKECYCTDMVGDNTDRYVLLVLSTVLAASDLADVISDSLNRINIENGINALHQCCKSFQTHTCVDVLLCQRSVSAVLVSLKLSEYQIPKLHISVAVASYAAGRLAAAILLAAVEIDLRAGAAGTVCTSLPEVVLLAHADDMIHRHTDLLVPDLFSLVIVLVYRYVKSVKGQLQNVGNILPSPCDSFFLEVVAKGEVTKHLKVSTVSCGLTNVLDITCSDALLTSSHTHPRRNLLTCKIRFQRSHTCNDQQQTLVVLGYKRIALVSQTSLAFKKFQIRFSQIIKTGPFHYISFLSKIIYVKISTNISIISTINPPTSSPELSLRFLSFLRYFFFCLSITSPLEIISLTSG